MYVWKYKSYTLGLITNWATKQFQYSEISKNSKLSIPDWSDHCCFFFNIKQIPFSGRNPVFQDTLNVKPHLLVLNKMDLADLSAKQVHESQSTSAACCATSILKYHQRLVFVFTLQRVLKKLEKSGVSNVLFTDSLKQRDDNIKKVTAIFIGC